MTDKETLKLALDLATMHHTDDGYAELRAKVRSATKEALAQPEQEPVAWYIREKDVATTDGEWAEKNLDMCEPLYTTPPQRSVSVEQEPVVWMYVNRSTHETIFQRHMRSFVDHGNWTETPLYSEPLANHELNCVCGAVWCGDEMVHLPHKSTQPQRTWVGLTDEERESIAKEYQSRLATALMIEAKLKEKNT